MLLNGSVSETALLTAVESLLEGSTLTGTGAQVAAGEATTEQLLIFHSTASANAKLIVRYKEGGTKDDDFSGELSLVGIFDGGNADILNANIT